VKLKGAAPAVLSPDLRTLLVDGPWALGQRLSDLPPHDVLRRLWALHGPAIVASLPRGRHPWFEAREAFVRAIRGESRTPVGRGHKHPGPDRR